MYTKYTHPSILWARKCRGPSLEETRQSKGRSGVQSPASLPPHTHADTDTHREAGAGLQSHSTSLGSGVASHQNIKLKGKRKRCREAHRRWQGGLRPKRERKKNIRYRQARNPHAHLPPGSLLVGPRDAKVPETPRRHSPPANRNVHFRKISIKGSQSSYT